MTDPAPAVTGKPLRWLRLDGLVLLAAALILFASTHQPWWLVPAVILLPDLFMLGYLRGTRAGAAVYNLGHSYPLPAAMSLTGAVWHHPLTLALGLLPPPQAQALRGAFGLAARPGSPRPPGRRRRTG